MCDRDQVHLHNECDVITAASRPRISCEYLAHDRTSQGTQFGSQLVEVSTRTCTVDPMIGVDLKQLSDDVEQVSQVYAERFGIERDATWFLLKLQEEVGELTQAFLMVTGQARDKGRSQDDLAEAFRQEVADVFCQTLLIARFHDIDLPSAVNDKWLVWTTSSQDKDTEPEATIAESSSVAEVLDLERELQTAECRRNSARVRELLADDFTEVGASGEVWDRPSLLKLLEQETDDADVIDVRNLTGRVLDDGYVLTLWDSQRGTHRARRSSVWRRSSTGWELVHHQGTALL